MNSLVELIDDINDADCILVGIGEEFLADENSVNDLIEAYNVLANALSGKNYFVVSILKDTIIYESDLDNSRITTPFAKMNEQSDEDLENNWDNYLKWLSFTLNKKLVAIELGVYLNAPEVIRWPFEKTVLFNNKAHFYRINDLLANVPEEISQKATSLKKNAVDFLLQ